MVNKKYSGKVKNLRQGWNRQEKNMVLDYKKKELDHLVGPNVS